MESDLRVQLLDFFGIPHKLVRYAPIPGWKENLAELYWNPPNERPTFSGSYVRLTPSFSVPDVIHEIAHYVVASPKERTMPNYGCGSDPYGGVATKLVADDQALEVRACVIDVALHYWLDMDWVERIAYLNLTDFAEFRREERQMWSTIDEFLDDDEYSYVLRELQPGDHVSSSVMKLLGKQLGEIQNLCFSCRRTTESITSTCTQKEKHS